MSQHSSNGRDPWWQKSADNRHFIVDGADAVIGRGAFGTTYRMRHTVDGRLYAVKAIDTNRVHHLIEALQGVAPGSLSKTSTREKVKGEALLLANLNHANCVRYATAWFEGMSTARQASVYHRYGGCLSVLFSKTVSNLS